MALAIVDSGSTKADWRIVEDGEIIAFRTEGYNPYFISPEAIRDAIRQEVQPRLGSLLIDQMYFYGAGCAAEERKSEVISAMIQCFPNAKILVETDLLGAARALLGNQSGMVAILGTGTNTGLYDGQNITLSIDSAGYLLGDEGSGAYIGKLIVRNWLRKFFSKEVDDKLTRFCTLSRDAILAQLYNKPYPNRFLADFARFAAGNMNEDEIRLLVTIAFDDFIENLIGRYHGYKNFPLYVTGSVGFVFRDLLETVCRKRGVELGDVIQSPIEGLVRYHLLAN